MNKEQISKSEESKALTTVDEDQFFSIGDNMEGVTIRLPQINILHQAALFELPDGSTKKEMKVIILDTNKANAWWEFTDEKKEENKTGSPPQCFSLDGIKPSNDSEKKQNNFCNKTCSHNIFGTDKRGKGKACKNMRRVHVFFSLADLLPMRLTLPPSSLKDIDAYITSVSAAALPYQKIWTHFSLIKDKEPESGQTFSRISCKMGERLTPQQIPTIGKLYNQLKPIIREQMVELAEYTGHKDIMNNEL